MSSRALAAVAFAGIAVFGVFSIFSLSDRNGMTTMFAAAYEKSEALFASRGQTSKTDFTGVAGLDAFLDQLLFFTLRVFSGESKALSLFSAYFTGQVTASHAIIVLEGVRSGNSGKIISYSAFWGVLYQAIPQGIIVPIYCALYLWKSPLATGAASARPLAKAEALSIDPVQASAVPGAMILGFILHTVLMALPAPEVIPIKRQQAFFAIWQFFPIWISLWQYVLAFFSNVSGLGPRPSNDPVVKLRHARGVYRSLLLISSVLHFGPIAYMILPSLRTALSGTANVGAIDFETIFVPMSAFAAPQVASVAEGCQTFLQYDMYCAFGALLLWIVHLSYVGAGYKIFAAVKTVFTYAFRTLLVGPGGALLWAVWDRDEAALSALPTKQKI